MKKLILTTMTLGVLASGASASIASDIRHALDPHTNAFSSLYKKTTGGYSSWKARKRACLAFDDTADYKSGNGECVIYGDKSDHNRKYGDFEKVFYRLDHIE